MLGVVLIGRYAYRQGNTGDRNHGFSQWLMVEGELGRTWDQVYGSWTENHEFRGEIVSHNWKSKCLFLSSISKILNTTIVIHTCLCQYSSCLHPGLCQNVSVLRFARILHYTNCNSITWSFQRDINILMVEYWSCQLWMTSNSIQILFSLWGQQNKNNNNCNIPRSHHS